MTAKSEEPPARGDAEPLAERGQAPLPGGGWLHYEVAGPPSVRGHPLLLVRPVGGSIALWGAFRAALAREFTVIAFDARGVGGSSPAPPLPSTRAMARDARHLLDHLAIDGAHVFGISLGGMVATWLAIDAPARVSRLVLASTLPAGRAVGLRPVARQMELAASLAAPPGEVEARLARRLLSRSFRASHRAETARITRTLRAERAPRSRLIAQLLAAARHDVRRKLHRVRAPTLVLAGELDALAHPHTQRRLAARLPDARFELVPACGHDLTLERPEETAARVAAFLRGEL